MIQQGNLANFRKSYEKSYINNLNFSPFIFLKSGLRAVEGQHIIEPNAMTLSTISSQNCPKARVVLLKKFDSDGFTFTNYNNQRQVYSKQ